MKRKKLVLFDIDGTLINPIGDPAGLGRFPYAIKKVFNLDVSISHDDWPYSGIVDRGILWDLVKDKGVKKYDFEKALPDLIEQFIDFMKQISSKRKLYKAIPDAVKLLNLVTHAPHLSYGLLTGNLGPVGLWKLKHAGINTQFSFGLYGHETEDRESLAKLVFSKAKNHFGSSYGSEDIIILGDTKHDALCAHAIGAYSVIVTGGFKVDKESLLKVKPKLLVDSLMDKLVFELLGLEQ